MSAISHFQTYSQRENHVTNNTMLMLRHVYRTSPRLLQGVIQAVLDEDEVEIGPSFEQQVRGSHSVPDAVIHQKPLNLYVEAKHGDGLSDKQIEDHMRSISAREHPKNSAFLIGLTTNTPSECAQNRWSKKGLEYGITFASTTYHELLTILAGVCATDPELLVILEDYESFIGGENLLPDQYRKIVAMLCGQSWKENIAHGIYFEPDHRNPKWVRAHFLGVYRRKCISHVGRLEAVAVCKEDKGNLIVEGEELGQLSHVHKDRIQAIIKAANYYPDLGSNLHRYYLVDQFSETDVRKTSSGGMMGHRYFDIERLSNKKLPKEVATGKDIACLIRGGSFE